MGKKILRKICEEIKERVVEEEENQWEIEEYI